MAETGPPEGWPLAGLVSHARRLADDVLLPSALDVDRADRVPAAHLDQLAAAGLYDMTALSRAEVADVAETLAGGCLATTFVWLQHLGVVTAVAGSPLRAAWLTPLRAGATRAAVALTGLRPGAAPLSVTVDGDALRLTGEATWVTRGWGLVDVIAVGALIDADTAAFLLMDAAEADTLAATRVDLVAVGASRTVTLVFNDHPVPADRLIATRALAEWRADEAAGSMLNGFLALGVVRRCLALLADTPGALDTSALVGEYAAVRAALLGAEGRAIHLRPGPPPRRSRSRRPRSWSWPPDSRSVLRDQHAQRLAREALFLLVFGTRPVIRDALLGTLLENPIRP